MTESAPASTRLLTLLVTLPLNLSLLSVSVLWLAGQVTTMVAWCAVAGGDALVILDREGWIVETLDTPAFSVMQRSSVGVVTDAQEKLGLRSWGWVDSLSDSNLRHPAPGIVRAHGPFFDIVGFRHWFVFLVTLTAWCLWHFVLTRPRQPAPVPEHDTASDDPAPTAPSEP